MEALNKIMHADYELKLTRLRAHLHPSNFIDIEFVAQMERLGYYKPGEYAKYLEDDTRMYIPQLKDKFKTNKNMKIETKYDVGDAVWFMYNSVPVKSTIRTITVIKKNNSVDMTHSTTSVVYEPNNNTGSFVEDKLHKTLDDLLDHLRQNANKIC